MSQTERKKVGDIGENIVAIILTKKDFNVLGMNYRKKWGEIDIIAQKDNKIHFVEVKTVSEFVSCAKPQEKRPEENMHPRKLNRLSRAIRTYLLDMKISNDTPWQLDLACVFLDQESKKARVRFMNNIIIGT